MGLIYKHRTRLRARDHAPNTWLHALMHSHTYSETPTRTFLRSRTCILVEKCMKNMHKLHKHEHYMSQDTVFDIIVSKSHIIIHKKRKTEQKWYKHVTFAITASLYYQNHIRNMTIDNMITTSLLHHHCLVVFFTA